MSSEGELKKRLKESITLYGNAEINLGVSQSEMLKVDFSTFNKVLAKAKKEFYDTIEVPKGAEGSPVWWFMDVKEVYDLIKKWFGDKK
jgi:hypothetical protein